MRILELRLSRRRHWSKSVQSVPEAACHSGWRDGIRFYGISHTIVVHVSDIITSTCGCPNSHCTDMLTIYGVETIVRCTVQLRFAYYMRGHHVFQLTMHILERPQYNAPDFLSDVDIGRRCHGQKLQNFTDYWSKIMSTTGRPTAATWTTVSVPLPKLHCR